MRSTMRPIEFTLPPSGSIVSYKIIYVLCTINEKTNMLKATHYCACLSAGREPVWGVWSINGRFQRFFNRKIRVEEGYPKHVWRRLYGTWTMVSAKDMSDAEKHMELAQVYHEGKQVTGKEGNVIAFRSNHKGG